MDIIIRPLEKKDLDTADHVFRLAFGTEFQLPHPAQCFGDADLLRVRWRTNPQGCLVAQRGSEIVGVAVVMDWGSVAVLGPVCVHPDYWNQGIARLLIPEALKAAEAAGARLVVLHTFPNSPRRVRLCEDFGFRAGRLTAVMSKAPAVEAPPVPLTLFSQLTPDDRSEALAACRRISSLVFKGLDLTREILAAAGQGTGETVLLHEGGDITGFALCHEGPGSEAGSGTVAVKFGAVSPGADDAFRDLLAATQVFAGLRGAAKVEASVNLAREYAYEVMKELGFRVLLLGIGMHRPAIESYDMPGTLVVNEWR